MSRPNIMSPDYVYRPWPEERRKKASAAAIARSGAKPGHRLLYRVQVPIQYWPLIKYVAQRYRNMEGPTLKETRAFIKKLLELLP